MTRQNPFRGLMDMSGEMDRMRSLGKTGWDESGYERYERRQADAWAPTTDIFCRGGDLVVCLELPGLAREDVEVSYAHGVLTVWGARTTAPGVDDNAFWQRERPYGAFRRTIALPEHTGESAITATARNGLLVVTVTGGCSGIGPEPRRIPISEGPPV